MIMDDKGKHIELNSVDESLVSTKLFPRTTSDDVVINDGGATLSTYLPTIETVGNKCPIKAVENSSSTISDELFKILKK